MIWYGMVWYGMVQHRLSSIQPAFTHYEAAPEAEELATRTLRQLEPAEKLGLLNDVAQELLARRERVAESFDAENVQFE